MARLDGRPARVDVAVAVGDDFVAQFAVTAVGGGAYNFTGATVATVITDVDGVVQASNWAPTTGSGTLTLTLTDTATTALGEGSYLWECSVTQAGITQTWLAGALTVSAATKPGSTSTTTGTLALSVGATGTITLTGTTGGTVAPAELDDLTDVEIGTPAKGSILAHDGSTWVDVGVGTNGQVLTADSGQAAGVDWADPTGGEGGGATTLEGLSDVTITAAAGGDLLRFDGTAGVWVDYPDSNYATASHSHSDATTEAAGFMSAADKSKLDGIEAAADVTDATNVDAAGAVMNADYDAHTILAATSDNTPAALTVTEQTLVGRITSGNIAALSASQVRTLLDVPTTGEAVLDTIIDAKGDLLVGSAADSVTRLAVGGTNGHVLKVASGETTGLQWAGQSEVIIVACSDETTAIDTTGEKVSFRMPFAMTLTAVRAHVTSACMTGTLTVDINEAGSSVLSTKLTIDAGELTSTTADVAAVISDAALADNAEVTIDVDDEGDGTATGLKVVLIGTRA